MWVGTGNEVMAESAAYRPHGSTQPYLPRGWLIFGANTTLIIHGYWEYYFQPFPNYLYQWVHVDVDESFTVLK